jgi:hypothetical protein
MNSSMALCTVDLNIPKRARSKGSPNWGENGPGRSALGLFGLIRPRSSWVTFSCLLELSLSYMWVLDVNFSAVWIGLLVAQASIFLRPGS